MTTTKFKTKSFLLIAIFGLAIFSISCSKDDTVTPVAPNNSNDPQPVSIAETAINTGFTELVGALSYVDTALNAGLVDLFMNGTDNYTVFAPTNEAFNNLYTALGVEKITDLPAQLVLDVLFYHVVEGKVESGAVVPMDGTNTVMTISGKEFTVDSQLMITAIGNQGYITSADIMATNGIIHVIDAVLLPIN